MAQSNRTPHVSALLLCSSVVTSVGSFTAGNIQIFGVKRGRHCEIRFLSLSLSLSSSLWNPIPVIAHGGGLTQCVCVWGWWHGGHALVCLASKTMLFPAHSFQQETEPVRTKCFWLPKCAINVPNSFFHKLWRCCASPSGTVFIATTFQGRFCFLQRVFAVGSLYCSKLAHLSCALEGMNRVWIRLC